MFLFGLKNLNFDFQSQQYVIMLSVPRMVLMPTSYAQRRDKMKLGPIVVEKRAMRVAVNMMESKYMFFSQRDKIALLLYPKGEAQSSLEPHSLINVP